MSAVERELHGLLRAAAVPEELALRLACYGALLLEANVRVNLTGAKDPAALLPHLLDALELAPDTHESLVDVGSGGGLPGIPLALATGVRLLLIEAIGKKAAFLRRALSELGLAGDAAAERAEVVARDARYRECFATATARAVASAPAVAELTVPFLRIGGRALLQRGGVDPDERAAIEDAAPILGAVLSDVRCPAAGRTLIVLTKVLPTGPRFPRRNGLPEKRPLCLHGPRSARP